MRCRESFLTGLGRANFDIMKNILVLTDFSIRAGYAVEFAMHLAIKNEARLLLCHALEPFSANSVTGAAWIVADDQLAEKDEAIMDLKEIGRGLLKLMATDGGKVRPDIQYIADYGNVCDVAKKVIADNNVDIVVIGSHPSNALTRILSGSHVYSLIDKLDCPVLLIPESLRYKGIHTIAYATDLTFNNNKVIKYLVRVARPFQAAISVNHIFKTEFHLTEAEQATRYALCNKSEFSYPHISYHNLKRDNVKSGLFELISSGKADILATVHKRYDFFEGLFHKSISKLIADASHIPLMVLPDSFSKNVVNWSSEQLDDFCFKAKER